MKLNVAVIVQYVVSAGTIGILTLVVVATSVFIWTRRQEHRQFSAVTAWEQRSHVDRARGAETPEEAYGAFVDAVKRDDEEVIRLFSEGGALPIDVQQFPAIDRVTFFPDIVSGVARAVIIDDQPATTLTIAGRTHQIPAGRAERVLLFHQLTNGRWVFVRS